MLVRSRNGSALALPPFTTFTRPTRSTTKTRPEPSFATDTPTGSLNPSATLTTETFCAPGIVPPGRATSAAVSGTFWASAGAELNTAASATSHRAFICYLPFLDLRSPLRRRAAVREATWTRSALILGPASGAWKAASRDCDECGLFSLRSAEHVVENELLHRRRRDRTVGQEAGF